MNDKEPKRLYNKTLIAPYFTEAKLKNVHTGRNPGTGVIPAYGHGLDHAHTTATSGFRPNAASTAGCRKSSVSFKTQRINRNYSIGIGSTISIALLPGVALYALNQVHQYQLLQ